MTASGPDAVVGLGKFAVAKGTGILAALGLGSCAVVVMYDTVVTAGGMVHVVLPSQSLSRDRANLARFAETAVPLLLGEMFLERDCPFKVKCFEISVLGIDFKPI